MTNEFQEVNVKNETNLDFRDEVQRAADLYDSGDYEKALSIYQKLGDRFKKPTVFRNRGVLESLLGQDEQAEKSYKRAEELEKEHAMTSAITQYVCRQGWISFRLRPGQSGFGILMVAGVFIACSFGMLELLKAQTEGSCCGVAEKQPMEKETKHWVDRAVVFPCPKEYEPVRDGILQLHKELDTQVSEGDTQ